ncbi:SurA N-terminal domain-containing protein [Ningiella sp. W23]|uniref:SurA N-terminal domain-containing protein n=1 Tax=Ningiella sp. W23 TaxID=3023715 RepID=UPI0037563A47
MLERIREGVQGPWAIAIVALIVVSFVFTGVGGYLSSSASTAAATVNEKDIPASTLEIAYQNERARMESQFGEAISSLFASESYLNDFRQGVLDRLINEELIAQKADALGLRVGDEQIKQAITALPEFQIAGQFSNDAYNAAIQRAGFTPSEFAEYMRTQMTRQQLVQALNGSSFNVSTLVSNILSLRAQQRDISIIEVPSSSYLPEIELNEEEIVQYYNDTINQYDTEEEVKLAYVSLSVDDLLPSVDVTEEEVAEQYEQQIGLYRSEEQRSVSHILIEIADDADAAREEAEAILQELQAGADFSNLAEQNSDDIVSAESGGELGQVNPGDYPEDFESAVFALSEEGQISDVVETEFGFHIIKLDSLIASVTTPLSEVAEQIRDEIRLNKATDVFFELQAEMQRLAFEVPDTLEEVAEAVNRPIFETVSFPASRYPSAVNFPQVENVAFSTELIEEGVNSELLQLSDDKVMVVRVIDHQAQRTKGLDEVREGIEQQMTTDKAQQAALAWSQDVQNTLLTGEDIQAKLDEKSLAWEVYADVTRNSAQLSPVLINAAFELSTDPANNTAVVNLNNGNVGIVKLDAIDASAQISSEEIEAASQQLTGQYAQRTYQNFIDALRADAEIVIMN